MNFGKANGDSFGWSIDVDSDVLVVGDPEAFDFAGTVYLFRSDGANWVPETELMAPPSAGLFGEDVSICGQTILIGARNSATPEFQRGAAYIYRFNESTRSWDLEAELTASDGDFNDQFGFVSLDGNFALVGAPNEETEGVPSSGAAYVFRFDGKSWIEEAKISNPDPQHFDAFGWRVAIHEDTALIGAPSFFGGAAYLYRRVAGQWQLEAEFAPEFPSGESDFGIAVDLARDVAVVGAQEELDIGRAYIYRYDGAVWKPEEPLSPSNAVGPFACFGNSVAISPSRATVLVGSRCDFELGFEAGAAYVFRWSGSSWVEMGKVTPSDGGSSWDFGRAVALLTEEQAFVGATRQSATGRVYALAGISATDCNHNEVADDCDILDQTSIDLNANGIPDECEAAGDVNGDGTINVQDLLILLGVWGPCGACPPACDGDTNGDCSVDALDIIRMLSNWS